MAFGPTDIVLSVRYQSDHELGQASQKMITREVQEKVGAPNFSLIAQRVPPSRKESKGAEEEPR